MIRPIGSMLQRAAWRLGYQVRKLPARRRRARGQDAFEDQMTVVGADDGRVIFDLGANVGAVTKLYRSLFPLATIHAFEPAPATYRVLCSELSGARDVVAHNLAIADEEGKRPFFFNRDNRTSSLLPVDRSYNRHYANSDATFPLGQDEVATTTLDRFCAAQDVQHLDILKMDIQGCELLALRGAAELLSRGAIDVIYSEVMFAPIYEHQTYFHELSAFLQRYGYVLLDLYQLNYTRNGLLCWSDAIWLSPKLEARRRCELAERPDPPGEPAAQGRTSPPRRRSASPRPS